MKSIPLALLLASFTSWNLHDCKTDPDATENADTPPEPSDELADNPLLQPSPHTMSAPMFDKIAPEHFLEAIEFGIDVQRYEVGQIASNSEKPSFNNTIIALEKSGKLLGRAIKILDTLDQSGDNEEIKAASKDVAALHSEHVDAMYQDKRLFERVEELYQNVSTLRPEQLRLVAQYRHKFIESGAQLDPHQQAALTKINAEIAGLSTQFGQNLSSIIDQEFVLVNDKSRLQGLSDAQIKVLGTAAEESGHPGQYLIRLVNTTRHPLLSSLEDRELRRELWSRSLHRGKDLNAPLAIKIAQLRDQKAKLLGFKDWAHWALDQSVAKTPDAVLTRLAPLTPKVADKTNSEAQRLRQAIADAGKAHELEPWDWLYYAEQVRQQEYSFDASELEPYFELNRVRNEGLFRLVEQLYGISLHERKDLPVYHPDVRVYELKDERDVSIGLLYTDDFARPGKRGGAWSRPLMVQNHLGNQRSVMINSFNFARPTDGEPTLLSYREVRNMFYIMGHALGFLLSDVDFPSQSSEELPRDFSGFHAQFMMYWALDRDLLSQYARHHETSEPIPLDLLNRFEAARAFNKGFDTMEYLKAAYLDLQWHTDLDSQDISSVSNFERAAFDLHNVANPLIPPRYSSNYFSHIYFSGYSAGYYSYLWTEIYAADAFDYLKSRGGATRDNGERLRRLILSRASSVDPETQFLDFRGRVPDVRYYLRRIGLSE